MNEQTIERVIEEHRADAKSLRNRVLKANLNRQRSFEELLAELSALTGFNVEDRIHAAVK